jgi:hypothetical protein
LITEDLGTLGEALLDGRCVFEIDRNASEPAWRRDGAQR